MQRTDLLGRVLAIAGTVLAWLPILAPLVLARWSEFGTPRFNFDYLMPAELLPAALAGGALLLWAAIRARSRRGLVAWSIGVAIASLVGGLVLAQVTGLASGATEPTAAAVAPVLAALAVSAAAVVALGVAGILLVRDGFAVHSGALRS